MVVGVDVCMYVHLCVCFYVICLFHGNICFIVGRGVLVLYVCKCVRMFVGVRMYVCV